MNNLILVTLIKFYIKLKLFNGHIFTIIYRLDND